jgi:quinol monooxygenase YgiN
VLNEVGCYQYLPLEDDPVVLPRQLPYRDNTVTMVEQWESVQHLEAHLATPHMQRYFAAVEPWVEEVSLQILRPGQ